MKKENNVKVKIKVEIDEKENDELIMVEGDTISILIGVVALVCEVVEKTNISKKVMINTITESLNHFEKEKK